MNANLLVDGVENLDRTTSRNTRVKLLSLIALAVLVLGLSYYLYRAWEAEQSTNREQELAEALTSLFVRTAVVANATTAELSLEYYGLPGEDSVSIEEILLLLEEYENISSTLFPETFPGAAEPARSSLEEVLWKAFNSYYGVANSSKYMYESLEPLDRVLEGVEDSLKHLVVCDVNGSLEAYEAIRRELVVLRNLLHAVYIELLGSDPSALLSDEHRAIREKAVGMVSEILGSLDDYVALMETVRKSPGLVEEICLYSNNSVGELSGSAVELLHKLVEQVENADGLGSATSPYTAVKHMIANAYLKLLEELGQGGSGAGYYNATEAD